MSGVTLVSVLLVSWGTKYYSNHEIDRWEPGTEREVKPEEAHRLVSQFPDCFEIKDAKAKKAAEAAAKKAAEEAEAEKAKKAAEAEKEASKAKADGKG